MTKLYELSNVLAIIHHELEESGGELTFELEKKLDELVIAFEDKCEGIVRLVRNTEGDEIALVNEISRLKERLDSKVRLRERLENYLKTSMEVAGKEEVDLGVHGLLIIKNPPSVEILDEQNIPARFVTIKETRTVDKRAILAELKEGKEIGGAKLIINKTRLKIK